MLLEHSFSTDAIGSREICPKQTKLFVYYQDLVFKSYSVLLKYFKIQGTQQYTDRGNRETELLSQQGHQILKLPKDTSVASSSHIPNHICIVQAAHSVTL